MAESMAQPTARPAHGRGRPAAGAGRRSLATQTAVVTTVVAVIAVLLSFLVSASLVRGTAERQARNTLGHYAELIAEGAVTPAGTPTQRLRGVGPAVRALYRLAEITPLRVRPTGQVNALAAAAGPGIALRGARAGAVLPGSLVRAAAAGRSVDATLQLGGHPYFVAGRPLPNGDGSVVLLQRETATSALTRPLRGRLLIALFVGLVVAAVAGVLLSRRLARPLARAADAAGRLSRGRRDVRLAPEGPREVVAVSAALNSLATALASSEQRQRDFLLSVSHELRTPLTAVTGYAEALADGVVPAGETAAVGATMLDEGRRLDRLVSDLLDLARLGAADFHITPAATDIAELVRAAGTVWADRCAREGVRLQVDVPPGRLMVSTDAGRVRQIVDGLAENALRVTPVAAPIVLAARAVAGGGVAVEVRDGGPGLTDDDLRVAFERSALYDRYRGVRRVGTGLGLALIAGLAARLGGHATAGHAPEGGARFTVTLPPAPPSS